MSSDAPTLARKLLRLAGSFAAGEYGVALGGAHAKGSEDGESDLDLYVFCRAALGDGERTALAEKFDPGIRKVVSWGGTSPFVQAGTDFYFGDIRVECWLRGVEHIERTIADCLAGVIRREFTAWTPTGFYNYCTLSDLKVMRPLHDPDGLLAGWQAKVKDYPPRLAESITGRFLGEAGFWPRNFHYASAVERRDAIYCAAIAQQIIHGLIQVLFALNRVYFPGDKKLAETLSKLPVRPAGLNERIEGALFPAVDPDVEDLRRQRSVVEDLYDEVARLAGARGGGGRPGAP